MKEERLIDPQKIKKYWRNQKPPDLEYLKKNKKKFVDKSFPPKNDSIIPKKDLEESERIAKEEKESGTEQTEGLTSEFLGKIVWRRPKEIDKSEWKVFYDNISIEDVKQGEIEDCYFISTLAALTAHPNLIKEKFRTKEFNEEGYYELVFFIDGEWQIVFVDDFFPVYEKDGNMVFAQPNGNELWVILLEKAWAKLNGSYSKIKWGTIYLAISALTGFPTEHLIHKDYSDKNNLYSKLETYHEKRSIKCCGTKNDLDSDIIGLHAKHAYSLIDVKKKEEKNEKLSLLQLRNPWGEDDWKGDWSDESTKWTADLIRYFGLTVNSNDGIFWMDINSYFENFNSTDICHIFYNAKIKNFYFENKINFENPIIFNLGVKEKKSKISIKISFKSSRFNDDIKEDNHPSCLIIGQYNEDREISGLVTKWSAIRDISYIEDLEPGFYVIWFYCHYNKDSLGDNFMYAFQISSENEYDAEFIGIDKNFELLQYILLENYSKEAKELSEGKPNVVCPNSEMKKQGIGNYLMYNYSDRELTVTLTKSFKENSRIYAVVPKENGGTSTQIKIPPHGRTALLGIRLTKDNEKKKFVGFIYSHQENYEGEETGLNKGSISTNENENDFRIQYFDVMKTEFSNNSNAEGLLGIRTGDYEFFGDEKLLNKETNSIEFGKTKKITKLKVGELNNEDKKYYEELTGYKKLEFFFFNGNIVKIQKEKGFYLGEFDGKKNPVPDGKGIFVWEDGSNRKYIGLWSDGKIDGEIGKYIFGDEYYEGEFKNNMMEGEGEFHDKHGNIWEGYFKNNMKNGVGIWTSNEGKYFLVKYKDNQLIGTKQVMEEGKEELNKRRRRKRFVINRKIKRKQLLKECQEFYEKDNIKNEAKIESSDTKDFETKEAKKHRIYLEKIEEYKEKEPFMMEVFSAIWPLKYEEEMDYIKQNNIIYVGGKKESNQNKLIKQGRGVFFNGTTYYGGIWENDKPNGYFTVYNLNKKIIFKGFLLYSNTEPYLLIDPGHRSFLYFPNGEKYHGYFKNNIMNGIGTYYFSTGESWTGIFEDGKFKDAGFYFDESGLLIKSRTYKDGVIDSEGNFIRNDFNDPDYENKFKGVDPKIKEKLFLLPGCRTCSKELPNTLFWTKKQLGNKIYIGQETMDKNNYGKCCIVELNEQNPSWVNYYYFGYIDDGNFFGKGAIYDGNWKLIYDGEFELGKKHNFGTLYNQDGSAYIGYFKYDNKFGPGIIYYPNNSWFEGNFVNNERDGKGYLFNFIKKEKQEIIYSKGNVVETGEIILLENEEYQKELTKEYLKFCQKCIDLGYKKYYNLLIGLKRMNVSYLKPGIKEEQSTIYIGEMNSIGFKFGRGVLINIYTKEFYVGYFVNNEKSGQGIIYYENGKPKYLGSFKKNKPFGKGEYRYLEGAKLTGVFNEAGEGYGKYTFPNGDFWEGPFYGWTANGKGKYYNQNQRTSFDRMYEYGK